MTNNESVDPAAEHNNAADHEAEETKPFRIAGSLKILVSDDELEAGIAAARARQAELFRAKMRRWMEEEG